MNDEEKYKPTLTSEKKKRATKQLSLRLPDNASIRLLFQVVSYFGACTCPSHNSSRRLTVYVPVPSSLLALLFNLGPLHST